MQVKDKVFVQLPTGIYYGEIFNINRFRSPDTQYAIDVHAYNGFVPQDGVVFAGKMNLIKMEVL